LPQDIIGAKNTNGFKRHRTNLCREESPVAARKWSGCSAWLRQALKPLLVRGWKWLPGKQSPSAQPAPRTPSTRAGDTTLSKTGYWSCPVVLFCPHFSFADIHTEPLPWVLCVQNCSPFSPSGLQA